jgi:hypothetical protein
VILNPKPRFLNRAQAPSFIWPTACATSAIKPRVFSRAVSALHDDFLPTFEAILACIGMLGRVLL